MCYSLMYILYYNMNNKLVNYVLMTVTTFTYDGQKMMHMP